MIHGRPGFAVVLVVSGTAARLETIAGQVSVTGCCVFCATPGEARRVLASAIVDLIVVLGDVPGPERLRINEVLGQRGRQTERMLYPDRFEEQDLAGFVARSIQ